VHSRKIWALVASLGALVALQASGWGCPESLDALESIALGYMGANVLAKVPYVVSARRGPPAVTPEVGPNGKEGGGEA